MRRGPSGRICPRCVCSSGRRRTGSSTRPASTRPRSNSTGWPGSCRSGRVGRGRGRCRCGSCSGTAAGFVARRWTTSGWSPRCCTRCYGGAGAADPAVRGVDGGGPAGGGPGVRGGAAGAFRGRVRADGGAGAGRSVRRGAGVERRRRGVAGRRGDGEFAGPVDAESGGSAGRRTADPEQRPGLGRGQARTVGRGPVGRGAVAAVAVPLGPTAVRAGPVVRPAGDFVQGAVELDAYAEVVAAVDEPAAARVRQQAHAARAMLN